MPDATFRVVLVTLKSSKTLCAGMTSTICVVTAAGCRVSRGLVWIAAKRSRITHDVFAHRATY